MEKATRLTAILSFVLFAAACNQIPFTKSEENKTAADGPSDLNGKTSPDPSNPTLSQPNFEIIKAAVFKPACFKCHTDNTGNKGDVNLERYDDVVRALSDIKFDLETDQMPRRAPPLDQKLKDLVYKWIELGAPQ